MTYKTFFDLLGSSLECSSDEQFIGEVGYPEWAQDDTEQFVSDLRNIWDVAHMSVKDMRLRAGLKQADLCEMFHIPRNTVQQWESSRRDCPPYVRIMLADQLGLITVERTLR